MTANVEKWQMRDPMLVLQSKQEHELKRMCTGCAHEHANQTPFGDTRMSCLAGHSYGRKCRDYMERISMTLEQSDEIEDLLAIWFDWSESYRPALGAPRASPFARMAPSTSIEHDPADAADAADERINAKLAEQVDLCIDGLPGVQYRAAIGMSMRNKRGPAVWRSNRRNIEEQHHVYQQAKELLMPLLRKRELMRN